MTRPSACVSRSFCGALLSPSSRSAFVAACVFLRNRSASREKFVSLTTAARPAPSACPFGLHQERDGTRGEDHHDRQQSDHYG